MVSQVIRDSGGVVLSEQLAPYLTPPPLQTALSTVNVNEQWLLPVVAQLGTILPHLCLYLEAFSFFISTLPHHNLFLLL